MGRREAPARHARHPQGRAAPDRGRPPRLQPPPPLLLLPLLLLCPHLRSPLQAGGSVFDRLHQHGYEKGQLNLQQEMEARDHAAARLTGKVHGNSPAALQSPAQLEKCNELFAQAPTMPAAPPPPSRHAPHHPAALHRPPALEVHAHSPHPARDPLGHLRRRRRPPPHPSLASTRTRRSAKRRRRCERRSASASRSRRGPL